ncbi:cell wall-binding repeat-containing protein [Herbiconiux sp. CPCC 205716]|uniref:Cell wall-binding repeat-containing protein n=1 Tax=Herbiconiux gentiana TaxID=2970912 RepID=A0ABT2GHR6_9MICO|nr:cell wall-binding repeat-containing protein [Herbiconiux gentiana]MCS5715769.1 cell wall-binding repeat-containing protein [Herbiconiux gentiana]
MAVSTRTAPTRSVRAAAWAVVAAIALAVPLVPTSAQAAEEKTVRVSLTSAGAVADRESRDATVSADGRFVAFSSRATNLGGPTDETSQIYVRDVVTRQLRLVSAERDGAAPANSDADAPSISADGRFVAYSSSATNLEPTSSAATRQVFVRDLAPGGATRLVSINSSHLNGGVNDSTHPSISADGTKVAFQSTSFDLIDGMGMVGSQIYVADLTISPAQIDLVSKRDQVSPAVPGNADSVAAAISANGSAVAFQSLASDLTADVPIEGTSQVFVGYASGRTRLASTAADAPVGGGGSSFDPDISADGAVVVYASLAANLVSGSITTSSKNQVYSRTMSAPGSELVSVANAGGPGNGDSSWPDVSADGTRVAFSSDATNLAAVDNRGFRQVFLRTRPAATTTIVSATAADPARGGAAGADRPHLSANGSLTAFQSSSQDLTSEVGGHLSIYLRGGSAATPTSIERIGGADRFVVSAAVSAKTFPVGVPVAYVASGEGFSDALSGSAAAGYQDGPVLLVRKDAVPEAVRAELDRLDPARIVVLGGVNAVSDQVKAALKSLAPTVTRIGGADRFVVSAAISTAVFPIGAPVAFVASGSTFPDALAGSAAAGKLGGPVLLVTKDAIPGPVKAELERLRPGAIVVLGGRASIGDAVADALDKVAPVSRQAGQDRFETAAQVSAANHPLGSDTVYVASGETFPDALSGSAAAVTVGAPVLLVTRTGVPAPVATELDRLQPRHIIVLGGANAVPEAVLQQLKSHLAG